MTRALAAHDIQWIGNAETIGVAEGAIHVVIHADNGSVKKENIPYGFGVCWPRFGGIPAIANSALPTDTHGLLKVDHYLRSERYEKVFAAGICIVPGQIAATHVEVGLPQTVDAIQEEVRVACYNLVASVHGWPLHSAARERTKRVMGNEQDDAAYMSALLVPVGDMNGLKLERWVYEAKKEFERRFLNMIMFGFEQGSHQAALIRTLRSNPGTDLGAVRLRGRQLVLELDQNTSAEVDAMASALSQNPSVFASALLTTAVHDAKICLTATERTEVQRRVEESMITALQKEEAEQLQFEGGAP